MQILPSRGSGTRAVAILIALVVGLGAGGAAGFFGLRYIPYFKPPASSPASDSSSATASDLVFLPDDCQVFASVSVPKFLESKSYKLLEKEGVGLEEGEIAMVRRLIGVAPDEIERLTLGANFDELLEWTLIVRARNAVRIDELTAGGDQGKLKERSADKQTIYERSKEEAFFVADDKTVVLGPTEALECVLKRGGPTKLAAGLEAALPSLNDTWALWVGVDVSVLKSKQLPIPAADFPGADELGKQVKAVVVESPSDKPLNFQVVVRCKDDATAQALSDQFNLQLRGFPAIPNSPMEMLQGVRFWTSGPLAATRVNVDAKYLVEPLKQVKWQNPDYWVTQLTSSEEANRQRAIGHLKENPRLSLPFLVRGLDKDQKTREAVLNILLELKEQAAPAAPAVARLVTHHQEAVRLQAVKVLRGFGKDAKRDVLVALLQAESDSNDAVRLEAKRVLADLGPPDPSDATYYATVAANDKAEPRTRASALQAFAKLAPDDPKLMPSLLEALKDKAKELRAAAARSLGEVGAKQRDTVFPALVTALKDSEEEVRAAAAAGLEGFGAPNEKESSLLVEVFKATDATPAAMATTAKLLGKAGPAAGKDAFPLLLGGLAHDDKTVREACAAALEALPPPDVAEVPSLVRKLDDAKTSPDTKRFVLKTLAKFGDKLAQANAPMLRATLMKLIENDAALAEPALQVFASLGKPENSDVPALMRLMQSKTATPATRGYAAKALAPLAGSSPEIVKALLTGLADDDVAIRRLAAEGLTKAGLKKRDDAEALAKALDDKDAAVRLNVVTALVAMPPAAKTYGHLLRAYVDADPAVMSKAVEGLKGAQPDADILAAAVQSPHLSLRLYALSELAEKKDGAGPIPLEPLVKATRDDSATVRLLAVNALAASGADPTQVAPTLVGKLKDTAPDVRFAALMALVELKQEPKEVIPILLDLALDKTNANQQKAIKALAKLGDWAKPALPLLMAAFQKDETRGAAGPALAGLGKDAAKELDDLLKRSDKDPALQIAVLETLAQIGPDARPALKTVLTLLANPRATPEVKAAAKKASDAIQKAK
jgi:HEAT repeat protein